jgi:hypothetical protein
MSLFPKIWGHRPFAEETHNHVEANVTDLDKYTQAAVDALIEAQNDLDPTLGSDHTSDGHTATLTAGETVNFGDVCYRKAADSELYLADADSTSTMPAIVMALDTITDGNAGSFLELGYARDDSWSWTVNGLIYVSVTGTTGNTLTQTPPSGSGDQGQVIGYAYSATVVRFMPNLILVEIV